MMASSNPAEPFTNLRYTNADPPDINSDELSGSIRITFDKTTLLCDICLEDGLNFPAEGYCVDCSHYLCVNCYNYHRRPVPCRHHKLLDKQQMPKAKPAPVYKDECTDTCKEHGNEVIKFYCEECKQFGCRDCVTLGHKACKQVGYIPKLSKDFLQSQEYTSFKASLDSLAKKAATVLSEGSSNIEAVNSEADQCLREVRWIRKDIDSYFDELEKDIVDKIEKSRAKLKMNFEKISKQCEALSRDIGELQLDVTDKENKDQKCRLFFDTKQALNKLKEYDVKMRELESENKVEDIHDLCIPSDLESYWVKNIALKFGVSVGLYERITINTSKEEDSNISGICILSNNKVALADHQNHTIKVVDTESNSIVTSEDLGFVWGITRVSDSEVAVMKGGNIAIYSVTNQEIKLKKTIRTPGVDKWSLLYTNNRFIVVTDTKPSTLRIVNMNGKVVKTISTEVDGKALFDKPWYMAVNPDHTRIYVSNWGMRTVTCLTFDGEVRARYNLQSGWTPVGVAVSRDGTVYVAAGRNHTIHILSSDLQERCVINGNKYGITSPYGLAYCDRDHKLYVGMWVNNEVAVLSV